MITNSEFKGTSGWVGTYSGKTPNVKNTIGAKVTSVYGYFHPTEKVFVSTIDELMDGEYTGTKPYTNYLKVTYPKRGDADYGILLNSGFYDNRALIKTVEIGQKWRLNLQIYNETGTKVPISNFEIGLWKVKYDSNLGGYTL